MSDVVLRQAVHLLMQQKAANTVKIRCNVMMDLMLQNLEWQKHNTLFYAHGRQHLKQ